MLDEALREFGLADKEIDVYIALAQTGSANVQRIAKEAKLPRTSVYPLLNSLIQRELVAKERLGGRTLYVVTGTSSFSSILAREREQLSRKQKYAEDLPELLKPYLANHTQHLPKVQYVESKAKIEDMLYEYYPIWNKSCEQINDFNLWGHQDHTFVESFYRWHQYAWSSADPRASIKLFSNSEGVNKQNQEPMPNREIRTVPEDIRFTSTVLIRGDFVILIQTRDKPYFAQMIMDRNVSSNLRSIFQLLWRFSLPR